MEDFNKTKVDEFILLAFSNLYQFQILLYVFILLMFILCITGNVTIIILVRVEPLLHSPMYFFISTLAFLEILLMSTIVPKLLDTLITAKKKISFTGCFIQLYVSGALGVTECYLLLVMAFDRYLAINKPLHYSAIMTPQRCRVLALVPWMVSFLVVLFPTILTANLDFCHLNEIDHFFCDFTPLQVLSCSNFFFSSAVTSSIAIFVTAVPFFIIMVIYTHIIIAISKIRTAKGKRKAFYSCSAHLLAASLYFVIVFIVYLSPKGNYYDKFLSLLYIVVTPMLNPFIYTFRNKNVKAAIWKANIFSWNSKKISEPIR